MFKEEWKPIAGYENLYEVSNLGRVRNQKHEKRSRKNNRGYEMVRLFNGREKKWHLVHRLVASAFCEKPDTCNVVNHIDNNPENNRADNLEWVTQRGNLYHAARIGVFTIRPVVRSNGITEKRYPSICSVQEDGFVKSCVCECCQGKRKAYKGYSWRYADE